MKRQGVTESPAGKWTRPEDYLGAMALKGTFRRRRSLLDRTEPAPPRLLLSTIPFFLLMGFLAVLAVAIMVTAFPGNRQKERPVPVAQKEQGVAAKGWFQEAQRDFHH